MWVIFISLTNIFGKIKSPQTLIFRDFASDIGIFGKVPAAGLEL